MGDSNKLGVAPFIDHTWNWWCEVVRLAELREKECNRIEEARKNAR